MALGKNSPFILPMLRVQVQADGNVGERMAKKKVA